MKRRRLWLAACSLVISGAVFAWMQQTSAISPAQDQAFAGCQHNAHCSIVGMNHFASIW